MQLITKVKNLEGVSFSPLLAYSALRREFDGESFLLESVEGTEKTARYSFIGLKPAFRFKSKGKEVVCEGVSDSKGKSENPYLSLKEEFSKYSARNVPGIPFSGGIVGYFSYDMVRFFEKLPNKLNDDLKLPDSYFILPTYVVGFDHLRKRNFLISHSGEEKEEKKIESVLRGKDSDGIGKLKTGKISSSFSEKDYCVAVENAKEHIFAGDIFQTVLSRRKDVSYSGDELAIYAALRKINPSPYLYFLDFKETKIIGSSPEMLVRCEGKTLTTRPIAGTRPRSENAKEDMRMEREMLSDEKERAEHVMLVDLHRNDLGRVSEYGSVKVTELMGVEKYSHVQHIVSNVVGRLQKGKDCFDALQACFPAGTVSGAPKIRAMEIIEELEMHKRGPYAGVAGYFDFSGNMDVAINIRSVFTKGSRAYVQAGAGIVADSIPEREFVETENKMKAMLEGLRISTE